ncbi:MAG: DNA repair and recombination protein RadA [Candidatus Lokiarchaeota archaeon]|nr:DNA repair and recombination protein RadA [Candidatus Lokiarchaeota archaeon]
MTELKLVKGIQARHIKIFIENGITTAEALAMSGFKSITAMDGIGEATSKKLIWNARSALGMTEFKSISEFQENHEFISTGSLNFNAILGGGIETGFITEVFGPFKSGKTNLAHTLCVTTQLPKGKGGLSGAVIYIDTENTFSKEKIKRITRRFGLKPEDVLSHIFHARIYSSDHQAQMILEAEKLVKEKNARLIILDSLMALLRAEYIGIGMLPQRQATLNQMIHALSRIAESYNIAILVTNQVAQQIKGMFSGIDAIGGNIVAHGCQIRVMLKTKGFAANNSLERKAIIVDAPDLPPEDCQFFITPAGIADTEKIDFSSMEENIETKFVMANDEFTLEKIRGIGKNIMKKLEEIGITTTEQLKDINPNDLAKDLPGISGKKVKEWIEQIPA